MKTRIINGNEFGGVHQDVWLANNQDIIFAGQLVSEWELTEVIPSDNIFIPLWNGIEWYESESIEDYNFRITPNTLTRMKFVIQVFITTGIKYEDIILFVNNLPVELLDDVTKYIILTRLNDCIYFERYSDNLILIANMMGITNEQLDEIFINGNLLD